MDRRRLWTNCDYREWWENKVNITF